MVSSTDVNVEKTRGANGTHGKRIKEKYANRALHPGNGSSEKSIGLPSVILDRELLWIVVYMGG